MIINIILRFLLIIGIIVGLFVWLFCWHKYKIIKAYCLAPILFSLHAIAYTALSAFNLLPKETYLVWGDLVSIHGVVLLISTGIVLINYKKGEKENG